MRRYFSDWKGVIYNLAFFLNALLVFLLLFESRFIVPVWMHEIGRLHPLVLHFPLAVLVLYGVWVLLVEKEDSSRWNAELGQTLLLIGAFTASIAAFSGFVLSKEDGYEVDTVFWHKWLGVAISLLSIIWYSFQSYFLPWKWFSKAMSAIVLCLLFVGGHLGGNLTHGEDFLTSPINDLSKNDAPKISLEDAKVYKDLIEPVLNQKCLSCHNAEKSKGGLQIQTQALFAKGGKEGILWDTTKVDLGLLLRRVHLPLDDKKHMPPRGKIQLTDEEVVLLAEWIKQGSKFDQMVSSLSSKSPIYAYAQNILGGGRNEEQYDFSGADADQVAKLNTNYRLVKQLSSESPALFVDFYNRASFKSDDIGALLPLKNQIISMDLSKMPVKDSDLKTLAQFPELRKLILNFTDITGASLGELKSLTKLRELSLSGTKVTLADVKKLEAVPSLRRVYVWSTEITTSQFAELKKVGKISFDTGFRSDTLVLALTPPSIINDNQILPDSGTIALKHQIPGVTIRYTLDGTEPDSVASPIYKKPFAISRYSDLKARAFKKGWFGSSKVEKLFLKAGFHTDSIRLASEPDPAFKGSLGKTLIDKVKGDEAQGSGKWLGFKESGLLSYLYFNKPVKASHVVISMLQKLRGAIFPPSRIEVWGGANDKSLKLLKVITPEVPLKEAPNTDYLIYEADFPLQELSCVKVMAKSLPKLPAWLLGERATAAAEKLARDKEAERLKKEAEKKEDKENRDPDKKRELAQKRELEKKALLERKKKELEKKKQQEKDWKGGAVFVDEILVN